METINRKRKIMAAEHLADGGGGGEESKPPNFSEIYKEAHPGAIEDVEKARAMAHASDGAETAGAEARRDAMQALLDVKDAGQGDSGYENPREAGAEAILKYGEAKEARQEADAQAEHAGKLYDQNR